MSESQFIPVTREGFCLTRDRFTLPRDTSALDPKSKRALTICNLFINHNLGIRDIVRVLDEDQENVIVTLLNQEIIVDRRDDNAKRNSGPERRRIRTVLNILRR
jgi:hypothetical protein